MNRLEFKAKFKINPGTGWEGTLVEWQALTDRTGVSNSAFIVKGRSAFR